MAGVTLEIGGRAFEVAPYKLRELRLAAPFIDQMNDLMAGIGNIEGEGGIPKLADMAALTRALCEILAIGLQKVDPKMDADALEAEVDFSFLPSLKEAIFALLRASGLARQGEVQAPSPPEAEGAGASEPSLIESSPS